MVTEIETRIYQKNLIYVPFPLLSDSKYPFEERDKVKIRIEGRKLIIEKK